MLTSEVALPRRVDEEAALRAVVEGTASETGSDFYRALARNLLRAALESVAQVAATDATVLILAETGTEKELFAQAIHGRSARRDGPLVKVNCAAIPATLIESEFFGHERGAFTGATARREGRFALADRGTIFLDEIAELPVELQRKLLRVLQEGEFEPVGAARTRKVDVLPLFAAFPVCWRLPLSPLVLARLRRSEVAPPSLSRGPECPAPKDGDDPRLRLEDERFERLHAGELYAR